LNIKHETNQLSNQAAWNYYQNKSNGEAFTNEELGKWNKDKKGNATDSK